MSQTTKSHSDSKKPLLGENDLADIEKRTKRQYQYLVAAAIGLIAVAIVTFFLVWHHLAPHNLLILGVCFVLGLARLVIAAFDTKAKFTGFTRHREEQELMANLFEKYKNTPRDQPVPLGIETTGKAIDPIKRKRNPR